VINIEQAGGGLRERGNILLQTQGVFVSLMKRNLNLNYLLDTRILKE
jgi:hypothetical protein